MAQQLLPENVLNALNAHKFNFIRTKEALDAEGGANILEELRLCQAQFSHYKNQFIALETKQGLLESLTNVDTFNMCIDPENIVRLENEVKAAKDKISVLKREIEALKESLRDAISELVVSWNELGAAKAAFKEVYNPEKSLQNRIDIAPLIEQNRETLMFGKVDDDVLLMDTRGKCNTILQKQVRVLEKVEAEITELQEQLTEFTQVRQPKLEAAIQEQKQRLARIAESKARAGPAIAALSEKRAWFQAVSQLLGTLSGITVDTRDLTTHNLLRVRFKPMNALSTWKSSSVVDGKTPEGRLVIEFNRDKTRFIGAHLVLDRVQPQHADPNAMSAAGSTYAALMPFGRSGQNGATSTTGTVASTTVDISDLVAYTLQLQDVGMLVRECQRLVLDM